MRRLRNFWRNLRWLLRGRRPGGPLPRPRRKPAPPGPPRVEFSYIIFWTNQARQWDTARRRSVADALAVVLGGPGFEANDYQRRYHVPGLDDQRHAGASLMALSKVLESME
jgi:hypothetical protein